MKKLVAASCFNLIDKESRKKVEEIFEVKRISCKASEKEMVAAVTNAKILIEGGEEKYTHIVEQSTQNLEAIIFVGNQYDTFYDPGEIEHFKARGIPIYKTGGGLVSVAAKTVSQITDEDFVRARLARNKKWLAENISELFQTQTVSVIGAGNIGLAVLQELKGKCQLKYFDPRGPREEADETGATFQSDAENAFDADVVTIHLAYIEGKTDSIITDERLRKIRKNGMFINSARAQLMNPRALRNFLEDRKDVICKFDVFWEEGDKFEKEVRKNDELRAINEAPNFMFTFHTAAQFLPEVTAREYGEGLLEVIEKNKLAD